MAVRGVGNGGGGGGTVTPTAGPSTTTLNNADTFGIFQGGTWKSVAASVVAAYVASAIAGKYLSTASASGANNDFTPVGFDPTINRLDVDTTAGNATITGLVAGVDNQLVIVSNIGANTLTLSNQDAGSAAANRFRASDSFTLVSGGSIWITYYGGTVTRWVITP